MTSTRFYTALSLTGLLLLAACGSDMRTMPNSHMQSLASLFAERDVHAPMPRGWRQLNGKEINYRFANETYAVYSVDEDEELLVMHLSDNGTGRLEADDDWESCTWNSMIDQLNIECDDTDMEWRIYTNGPDIVAVDLDEEEFTVLRKRPGG
jgi:hypothetical protein